METNNETVEQLRAYIKTRLEELWEQGLGTMLNGEVDELAYRIIAAHKREMKHNESLLSKAGATVVEMMNKGAAQHEEIKELRALVKELADALEAINARTEFDPYIGGKWTIGEEAFDPVHTGSLVDKAREVAICLMIRRK